MDIRDFIDMNLNEIRNFVVQVLASDPANTTARLYYNSTSNTLRFYNGSAWADLAAGAGYGAENAQDDVATAIAAGTHVGITVTYNDAGNSFSFAFANQAANTVLANITGGSAAPTAVTLASFKTWLALVPGDITGFDTQVRTNRLDQMAAPTASVSLNSQKITNLLDGTNPQDAASLSQVQGLIATGTNKTAVRAASTANGTLATAFVNGATMDGVTLATNDRILLKNQTTGSENGIRIVQASGAPIRATDADISAEVKGGLSVWVNEGTVNADTRWVLTTNDPITLDTTALVFTQDFAANATTAGAGLGVSGNVLSVNTDGTTIEVSGDNVRIAAGAAGGGLTGGGGSALAVGAGTGIVVAADSVAVDRASTVKVALTQTVVTTGGATSEVLTHALGTRDIHAQCWNQNTPWQRIDFTFEATSTTTVTMRSGQNIAAGLRVVLMA